MATHSRVVTYNDRVYRALPKYAEIHLQHVRKMVRNLAIDQECARRYVAAL